MTPFTDGPARKPRRYRSRTLARATIRMNRKADGAGSIALGEVSDRHPAGPALPAGDGGLHCCQWF
ncbi:hypothetical protein [Tateyamaria omphalii]|uniref:hypothetical protein n=1 Tax=Tateyamaria omphalii TaxID=299262 RepID=UPI0012FA0D79|nr:hypothetical protein [Tateyamaria omphalii]